MLYGAAAAESCWNNTHFARTPSAVSITHCNYVGTSATHPGGLADSLLLRVAEAGDLPRRRNKNRQLRRCDAMQGLRRIMLPQGKETEAGTSVLVTESAGTHSCNDACRESGERQRVVF